MKKRTNKFSLDMVDFDENENNFYEKFEKPILKYLEANDIYVCSPTDVKEKFTLKRKLEIVNCQVF